MFDQFIIDLIETSGGVTSIKTSYNVPDPPSQNTQAFDLDEWCNLNIRSVWSADTTPFLKMNIWRGTTGGNLIPDYDLDVPNFGGFAGANTVTLSRGSALMGVYWQELRLKYIDSVDDIDRSWLFYFRFYKDIDDKLYAHAAVLNGEIFPNTKAANPTAIFAVASPTDTTAEIVYCA